MDQSLKAYLQSRRTVPATLLAEPGPDRATIEAILTIAARVPDHGKLHPWRFVVYPKAERERAAASLARIAEAAAEERDRRARADKVPAFAASPVVVGVIFAPVLDHPKIPVWEQELSAGAACLNLIHAANAHGLRAQWLSGWMSYDPDASSYLGVREGERMAGLIHIGSSDLPGIDRDRPDVAALTTWWTAG